MWAYFHHISCPKSFFMTTKYFIDWMFPYVFNQNLFIGPLAYIFCYSNIWAQYSFIFLNNFFDNILLKWHFTDIILSQLLKKPEKGDESTTEKPKERGEEVDVGDARREPCPSCAVVRPRPPESLWEEPRDKWACASAALTAFSILVNTSACVS